MRPRCEGCGLSAVSLPLLPLPARRELSNRDRPFMFATTNRSWAALTTNTIPRPVRRVLNSARVDLLDGGEIVGRSGYRRLSGGDRRLSRPHHSLLRIAMSDRDVHVQRMYASCGREASLSRPWTRQHGHSPRCLLCRRRTHLRNESSLCVTRAICLEFLVAVEASTNKPRRGTV